MKRLVTTAMVIGVLAIAGCSGGGSASPAATRNPGGVPTSPVSPPAVTASPTVSSLNNASLPLDRYTTTADEYAELNYASKLMTAECMKRFGITYNPGKRLKLLDYRDRTNDLGLIDEAHAARFGYHMDPARYSKHDTNSNPGLTTAQSYILFGERLGKSDREGVPEDGCMGEGYRKVGWSTEDDVWLQELGNDAKSRAFADKRAVALMADWSTCMRKSGYRYDNVDDVNNDQRWWKDEDAPAGRAEKNTALADVRCKKKLNYLGTMTSILVAYQQQIVEANLERLESVRAATQQALKNAAAVLGGR
ncbi:hypothetical protein GCM10010168_83320 [Actinoplanes ianthinogenes]|uniref:Lipoprotein n=1 Tax=Actinoplanes ianthinogenes TaxID=122358 RepID=A0ABN6CPF7_9ACTN|nr:hypothetical protein [Actinoplanes ianthinogenes]BCJ47111.1 hypothetical protein Aiant_77680 [Actinoplanes ianthinogenes]GGR51766.1 hypothetical protein GCM10010168_83320 [Actinoplanes ianthinogenes]